MRAVAASVARLILVLHRPDEAGSSPVDPVVDDAVAAIERRDWETLTGLLHPYLRWTEPDGRSIRGRKRVLTQLAESPAAGPPSRYELRDGQIYRWVAGPQA